MAGKMYFGTLERMQMLNAALSELPVSSSGYSEVLNFVNGGSDVVSSRASSRVFDLSWSGTPSEINPFKHYQQGYYGDGLIYMVDPMTEHYNVIMPNWASPKLIEVGDWKNFYPEGEPVFSNTAANVYNQPTRTAEWPLTGAVSAVPENVLTLPIPPTKTLYLGVSGVLVGDAAIRVQPINLDGTLDTTVDMAILNPSSATRMNIWFGGSLYKAVQIYFTRNSTASSSVQVTSMMGQLWDTGVTPVLTGEHVPGEGFGGLAFASGINESYYQAAGVGLERKGASVQMVEVESWR
jgi:hypothetical protein